MGLQRGDVGRIPNISLVTSKYLDGDKPMPPPPTVTMLASEVEGDDQSEFKEN